MKDSRPQMIGPQPFHAAPDSPSRPRCSEPPDNDNEGQPLTSFVEIDNSSTLRRRQPAGQCESTSNPHNQFRLSESVVCCVEEVSSFFSLIVHSHCSI